MKNIITFALIGLVVGVLLAELFPNIGKGSFEGGLNDLAFSLGKQKPYLNFGAIGATIGAVIAAFSGKRS